MKIGVDCRYLGLSGIGRFLENILKHFDFSKNEYTLFGKKEKIENYKNANLVYTDESPFSKKGLFNKAFKITKKMDYFYSPNFIIPYTVKCKCITTLHDILFLDMKEVNGGLLDLLSKKILLKRCMKKSKCIFTVSEFSKKRISYYYPKYKDKIIYSYQGIEDNFKSYEKQEKENYIIFVGNIKKQKGLKTLIEAFNLIDDKSLDLFIVGDSKNFKNKDDEIINMFNDNRIKFTGFLSDEDLKKKVAKAKFLIQPSIYEGFGLPPLEALYLGTKPIISDIDVFKEVYSDLPVEFFKVGDPNDLKDKILNSSEEFELDKELLNKKFNSKNYSMLIEQHFE